jgi:Zn-dependent metalloprotease
MRIYRLSLVLSLSASLFFPVQAQLILPARAPESVKELEKLALPGKAAGRLVHFRPGAILNPLSAFRDNKAAFGLGAEDEVKLIRQETDDLGFTHYVFQQLHRGIRVEGAEYRLHSRGGVTESGNGQLVENIRTNPAPLLSPADAERVVKGRNPGEIRFASTELVYAPKDHSQPQNPAQIALCYKITDSDRVSYIDAHSGAFVKEYALAAHCEVGTASLPFGFGTRPIETTYNMPGNYYYLLDCRGQGVHTYRRDLGVGTQGSPSYINQEVKNQNSNTWNSSEAVFAHWAIGTTWDFFVEKFNRTGGDNAGKGIDVLVSNDSTHSGNAKYLQGPRDVMAFGQGDGTTLNRYLSLDIAAHEFTHGVTHYSAGLIGVGESNALNESFSDIFSTCLEFHIKGTGGNYTFGEDAFLSPGNAFRSMSNPSLYGHPDTYMGTNWISLNDHRNGGVQNLWFYLLSEGGSGVNDNMDSYSIQGISRDKAMQIAYRSLTVYLGSHSNFADARVYSIQAAVDLFGSCSQEAVQTAAAWAAVGVGPKLFDETVCGDISGALTKTAFSSITAGTTSSCAATTVLSGADVYFIAGEEIKLEPGFSVKPNAAFSAFIEDCTTGAGLRKAAPGTRSNEVTAVTASEKEFTVYPNPFSSTVQVEFELEEEASVTLGIYSLLMQPVVNVTEQRYAAGQHRLTYDLKELPAGVYFVNLRAGDRSITKKIVRSGN